MMTKSLEKQQEKSKLSKFNCHCSSCCGFGLIKSSFSESSVHGCNHIVNPIYHIIERIFWCLILILSIVIATQICIDQWNRYENKPTVTALETNYRNWEYDFSGMTICSNYTNHKIASEIIYNLWGLNEDDTKYQFYLDFIDTVSTTRYNNLYRFKRFTKDVSIQAVDMLEILKIIRRNLPPPSPKFINVITEMGMCFSTTNLYKYQNPYNIFENITLPEPEELLCRSIDICKMSITPDSLDPSELSLFIHNKNDVISAGDTYYETLVGEVIIDLSIAISDMRASDGLMRVSPDRRGCVFMSESGSTHFQDYTVNLCRISCRVNKAFEYCKCHPFFYTYETEKFGPVCSPAGLYCLSQHNWYNSPCECPKLCQTVMFTKVHADITKYFDQNKMMIITILFPRIRIKKNVLFSFEDLLVSFGGAAALFLGISFLSVVELIFYVFEYFWNRIFKK